MFTMNQIGGNLFEDWEQLHMNHKVSVVLRLTMVVCCICMMLSGRPPAISQPTTAVPIITQKDEVQDIQLGQLSDFKTNQNNWNEQTGRQLQALADKESQNENAITEIQGWQKGGFGVLTCLSVLAMFFQLKRRTKEG